MKRIWLGFFAIAVATIAWSASTTTTNWTLTLPGVGDTGWGSAVNSNFSQIDKAGATLDTSGLIRSAVVKSSHVATNGIAGSNLQADCVKSSHVADGTLLSADLSATAGITGGQLAANTITGSNLGANVVKSSHIVAGEIQGVNLGSAIVKSSHVFTNGLSGSNFEGNSIVSSMVVNGTLISDDLGTNRVAGSNLESNCVKSSHVVDASLTGADLAANTVSGNNLEAGAVSSSHVVVSISSTIFHAGFDDGTRITNANTIGSTFTASGLGGATDDIVTLSVPAGTTKVMVSMLAGFAHGGGNFSRALLYVDGVIDPNMRIINGGPYSIPMSVTGIVTVTANASHTFEIRYQHDPAAGTQTIDERRLQVWLVGN